MKVDLHVHTLSSGDADQSVEEAFRLAKEMGLAAIAITNHNGVDDIEEGMRVAWETGITFVPGVELEATFQESQIHLLAYSDNIDCPKMREYLGGEQFQAMCRNATPLIEALAKTGIPVSIEMYMEEAARAGTSGSPLFRTLTRHGYVKDLEDYYKKLGDAISPSHPYSACAPPMKRVVEIVHDCGALAIVAHPLAAGYFELNENNVRDLVGTGVDGLEVYHPTHTRAKVSFLLECAREYGLLVTGGSDYHGHSPREMGVPGLELPDREFPEVIHCRDLLQPVGST